MLNCSSTTGAFLGFHARTRFSTSSSSSTSSSWWAVLWPLSCASCQTRVASPTSHATRPTSPQKRSSRYPVESYSLSLSSLPCPCKSRPNILFISSLSSLSCKTCSGRLISMTRRRTASSSRQSRQVLKGQSQPMCESGKVCVCD